MYNVFVWVMLLGYIPSKLDEDLEEEATPIREHELAVRSSAAAREYQTSSISGYPSPPSSFVFLPLHHPWSRGLLPRPPRLIPFIPPTRFAQHDDL
jgi:hypothetical protein